MNFIIVGYDCVGSRIAQVLREEGHDMAVVDNDDKKVDRARDEGFEAILGDGGTGIVLQEAGIEGVDTIGGLIDDPNISFVACMFGKEHNCRTVMRVSEDYRQEIYEHYTGDVDEIIYPRRLGAAGTKMTLLGGGFSVIGDLTDQLRLATVNVPDSVSIVGRHVANIDLSADGHVCAHGREREPITVSLPGIVVEPDD